MPSPPGAAREPCARLRSHRVASPRIVDKTNLGACNFCVCVHVCAGTAQSLGRGHDPMARSHTHSLSVVGPPCIAKSSHRGFFGPLRRLLFATRYPVMLQSLLSFNGMTCEAKRPLPDSANSRHSLGAKQVCMGLWTYVSLCQCMFVSTSQLPVRTGVH